MEGLGTNHSANGKARVLLYLTPLYLLTLLVESTKVYLGAGDDKLSGVGAGSSKGGGESLKQILKYKNLHFQKY